MKNLFLIGMMGSGKTSTGKALAKELGMKFVDCDEEIVASVQMSVNEIFENRGESYFRKVEQEILRGIAERTGQVVATGGGAVLKAENIALMREQGTVVYLRTSIDWLWKRVQSKADRPLLRSADPKAVLAKLFMERKDLYGSAHHYAVNTDGKTPEQAAQDVLSVLKTEKAL